MISDVVDAAQASILAGRQCKLSTHLNGQSCIDPCIARSVSVNYRMACRRMLRVNNHIDKAFQCIEIGNVDLVHEHTPQSA